MGGKSLYWRPKNDAPLLLRRVNVRTVVNNRDEAIASLQYPLASTVFFQGVIFIGLSTEFHHAGAITALLHTRCLYKN